MNKIILLLALLYSISLMGAEKPNIIFMMSDDQGWDGLSTQMHPEMSNSKHSYIQTPILEKLATEGMRFSAAYAPSPVCSATRISLQTGKSPAALNWTKVAKSMTSKSNYPLIPPVNIRNISASEITIGESLQSAGYLTAHYGKWHINGGGPEKHGYHEHDGDIGNEYAANYAGANPADIFGMAERASNFMAKAKKARKPFFIQMSFHALHAPQNAIKETVEKYQKLNPKGREKEIGRAAISENLDTGVGVVLEALEKLKLEKNTYVIYMSDNGSGGKKGPLRGGKGGAWEGGVRSPMIVRGPEIAVNSWCHERVVGYDWYPTFCYWAGLKKLPAGIEGGNLNQVLVNEGKGIIKRVRKELVFHFPHYQGDTPHTALFLGDYKLMKFYETGELHLFNIKKDISESKNLVSKYPEKTQELYSRMQKYLVDVNAKVPVKNTEYDPTKPSISDKKGGKGKDKKKGKRSRS
jgi:arylsulfatase A